MVISVIGLGFVGLTTALGLASTGHIVYGIETNQARRETIKNGIVPFYEPHMQEALTELLDSRFYVEESPQKAISDSETVFFCVGTPFSDDGSADLSFVFDALTQVMPFIDSQKHPTLVIKSTVPLGTLKNKIVPMLIKQGYIPGDGFEIVNNPEFLREGNCWDDFINADRIVIGDFGNKGFENLERVYSKFDAPKIRVTPNTSEFIKYLSNTFLATMISYSNEMAGVAEAIGDVEIGRAFSILHDDRRWIDGSMSDYVYPGCGYGGYCLPKDTQAMLHVGRAYGERMGILGEVIRLNNDIPERIVSVLTLGLSSDSPVGILGLAFKPGTNDVRDSSAAKTIKVLNKRGFYNITAFDPVAANAFREAYPELRLQYSDDADEVIGSCCRTAIITAWQQFRKYKALSDVFDFRYMKND